MQGACSAGAAGRGGPTTHTPDPPLPANLGARVRRAREGELNVVGEDLSHGVGSPVRRTTDAEPGLQLHHSGGFSPSRVSFTSHCVEFHLPFWRAELTVGVPFWSAYVWSTTRHVWSANVEVSLLETYCWSTFVGVLLLEFQCRSVSATPDDRTGSLSRRECHRGEVSRRSTT